MNSLIRTYNDFIEQLKEEYAARGFQIVPSREVSTQLNFKPDLVVRRGNEVTIVEVKTSGRISAGQLTEMRRQAENLGYRFELKVLPRAPRKSVRPDEAHPVVPG
jgi:REase_AHJR-like